MEVNTPVCFPSLTLKITQKNMSGNSHKFSNTCQGRSVEVLIYGGDLPIASRSNGRANGGAYGHRAAGLSILGIQLVETVENRWSILDPSIDDLPVENCVFLHIYIYVSFQEVSQL